LTTLDSFRNYSLTNGQKELLQYLNEFLGNNTFCFLLKGYAGTGKTFMIQGLIDFLRSTNRPFILLAPTGRAARVIAQRTQSRAYTIHKTIYSNTDLIEFKNTSTERTETFKFYYNLRNNEDANDTIYIVDEASMLSDAYSEGEFFRFGSGFLLKDLFGYITSNPNHRRKIIFIGDNAQLPPVNMNFSPALSQEYLQEKYQISVSSYELTEVVRQQKQSGILHNATKIRDALKKCVFNQIDIETHFADINPVQQQDLLKTYLQACQYKIDDETIIVAQANSLVKEYNDLVRKHFFPNQNLIAVGDRVILVSNNYNYPIELMNGDFGVVQAVSPTNEIRTISLKRKNESGRVEETKVSLQFRDVTIRFTDLENKPHDIECKIIENLLYSKERDLSSDEIKALYIDFKIRYPYLETDTAEFKTALRFDKYFNALRVKFGYAITCHKAQGGEWKRVFVNCRTTMGYFNASYFRWLYTALTRAKEKLYTLNEPHFGVGNTLKPPRIDNLIPQQNVIILKSELIETELPFDLPQEQPFLKNIFIAVFDLVKDEGISIECIKHHQYCEHYTFVRAEEKAIVQINYNKSNKITYIQATKHTIFANAIVQILQVLVNKKIIFSNEQTETKTFEFDEPFLRDFYEIVSAKLNPLGISISNIEHKNYHEIYTFRRANLVSVYKFWYNSRKIFTKTEIIQSSGLEQEINQSLNSK